jgi:hypothetical protein
VEEGIATQRGQSREDIGKQTQIDRRAGFSTSRLFL